MKVLLWVVALVPLAVFGVVASSVGQKEGMQVFRSLIWLIVVVLLGLRIQVIWYLLQMAVFARMSPVRFLAARSTSWPARSARPARPPRSRSRCDRSSGWGSRGGRAS